MVLLTIYYSIRYFDSDRFWILDQHSLNKHLIASVLFFVITWLILIPTKRDNFASRRYISGQRDRWWPIVGRSAYVIILRNAINVLLLTERRLITRVFSLLNNTILVFVFWIEDSQYLPNNPFQFVSQQGHHVTHEHAMELGCSQVMLFHVLRDFGVRTPVHDKMRS